jgi:hypothetical protein
MNVLNATDQSEEVILVFSSAVEFDFFGEMGEFL